MNDWRFAEPVAVGKVVLKSGTKWQFPLEINNYAECVEPSNLTAEQYQQLVHLVPKWESTISPKRQGF